MKRPPNTQEIRAYKIVVWLVRRPFAQDIAILMQRQFSGSFDGPIDEIRGHYILNVSSFYAEYSVLKYQSTTFNAKLDLLWSCEILFDALMVNDIKPPKQDKKAFEYLTISV